jgi:hypothetical protein
MMTLAGFLFAMFVGASVLSEDVPRPKDDASQAEVDEILTRLQKRSDGLKDILCTVKYVEEDRINLSTNEKHGRLMFLMADPNPKWRVDFTKTIMDEQQGKREWYMFDGRWIYEAKERTRQVIKREFARPGEKVDFFDMETAPLPLPFGQKKEQILEHFEVSIKPPAKGDPKDTDHLVCIPKPTSRLAEKYEKFELFVQRDVDLPSRIVVTKNKGLEVLSADFPDLSPQSLNTGIKPSEFSELKEWDDYELTVEYFQGSAPE